MEHMINNLDIFICPMCGGDLKIAKNIHCLKCFKEYRIESGIPLLFCSHGKADITQTMQGFYSETPFPNYEDLENMGDLIDKAERSVFMRMLNDQVPFNIRVLEVGCGTGQLTNYLSSANREVIGTDMCLNSLRLAENFKEKNQLKRASFYQMNLFRPIFKEESFPLVICNGVLHHTNDPLGGLISISKLVKRGGYIIIGLYNKYGRLMTDIRRAIFNMLGERVMFLDPHLRKHVTSQTKKYAWFKDQYKNPHESKHTIDEVLKWFDSIGFEFINSIPKSKVFRGFSENELLFKQNPKGNRIEHLVVQIQQMLAGSQEGGLFLMIGKRR